MRVLTVKKLRDIISEAPEDAIVLIGDGDHSYRSADVSVGSALQEDRYSWCEDHGESLTPEADYGKRVHAVIVS